MLGFLSGERHITGVDYDRDKITIAENCISRSPNINFTCADINRFDFEKSDAFILSDVLHYLPELQQDALNPLEFIENVKLVRELSTKKFLKKRQKHSEWFQLLITNLLE